MHASIFTEHRLQGLMRLELKKNEIFIHYLIHHSLAETYRVNARLPVGKELGFTQYLLQFHNLPVSSQVRHFTLSGSGTWLNIGT